MFFNSLSFFIFLFFVFIIYWKLTKKSIRIQNTILLIASYFFYSLWDWRFSSLILLSTIVDFYVGKYIHKCTSHRKRKKALYISIVLNIGVLFFFKYCNFFIDSAKELFNLFGYQTSSLWTLKIILPVGISFYTFQTLSYSLDIYRKKIVPTTNFIAFATFISFFPQLVAGPIEKASNLLPQIIKKRKFNYLQCTNGLQLILWGLFKKVAIADSLAPIVDDIFLNYGNYSSSTLVLGAVFFSFQLYGDFSGYSDIAIGVAKLFGIELMSNFKFPYLARNIAEHWQRWHISLSSWFKDYIYIPLGGNRVGKTKSIRNIFIVFLISGFWHGANWTFIIWGLLHATFYIPVFLRNKNRVFSNNYVAESKRIPSISELFGIITTFSLVTLANIFFRSSSVNNALGYFKQILNNLSLQSYQHPSGYRMLDYFVLLIIFIMYEFIIRGNERSPYKFKSKYLRFALYILTIFILILFYDDHIDRSFIYFQF